MKMKKNKLSALMLSLLVACNEPKKPHGSDDEIIKISQNSTTINNDGYDCLKTVNHTDTCEYVLWNNGSYGSCMVHSGNCHNPVHKKNKQ